MADGELARTYVGTIRLKLLKIGTVVLRNTRRCSLPQPRVCAPDKQTSAYCTHDPALDESCPEMRSPKIRQMT